MPKEVEPVVGVPHTDETASTLHAAPPLTPPGECVAKQDAPPWNELQTLMIQEKDPRRPPRIPHPRPKEDPQARVMERDVDSILRNATTRRFSDWQEAIRDSTPDDLPFTLFGMGYDGCSESSQTHTAPEPYRISSVPVSEVSDGSSTYRSVWDDPNVPVSEAEADYGAPAPAAHRLNDFFAVCPALPPDDAAFTIHNMRDLVTSGQHMVHKAGTHGLLA